MSYIKLYYVHMRTGGTCVVACMEYNIATQKCTLHVKLARTMQKEMADLQKTWAQKLSEAEEEWQERDREGRRRQEN